MSYKDITDRMVTGKTYLTDYLVTSIANEMGVQNDEVLLALDEAPENIIERRIDKDGNNVCELIRRPLP